jgi:hypothetical protein
MSVTLEGIKSPTKNRRRKQMDGKVSITITTDKPVKIRVTPAEEAGKEAEGLKRLLKEVKGGNGHVVSSGQDKPSDKR